MRKTRLDPGPFVLPMPTALVGAVVGGVPNFMTAAFVGIVNFKPAIVACGLSPTHHTCRGIAEHGEFSLGLPGPDLVEAVRAAMALARPGDAVLLSPGYASLDQYASFQVRGDAFAAAARTLAPA